MTEESSPFLKKRTKKLLFLAGRFDRVITLSVRQRWFPAALLLALVTAWFAVRTVHGIHSLSFGDESGHFLGARAIKAGDKLYRDFIDAHGPLSFMAAQLFGFIFGWREPLNARWGIALLVSLAAVAIYKSPVFRHTTNRLWGTAIFLGLIAAPWLVQSLNMVNYHVLGGILITVFLAQLLIPVWLEEIIFDRAAVIGGICLALLCADAYSLAPTAVLLAASLTCALWRRSNYALLKHVLTRVAAGFAVGFLAVFIWMLRFGDLVGYLVFHIINNQVNYSRYSSYGWGTTMRSLVPSKAPEALIQSGATLTFFFGLILLGVSRVAVLRANPVSRTLSLALLAGAILMTNFRGAFGFQDGTFLVASIALFGIALPMAIVKSGTVPSLPMTWAASFLIGLLLCTSEFVDRSAVESVHNLTRKQLVASRKAYLAVDYETPIYRRIRSILKPDERLLVLIYNPDFFLPAGFLPMRKFHEYLPWEADYARAPWFGRTRDLCAEITIRPPPIIFYDGWKVWGSYDPDTFIPCVRALLKDDYVSDTNQYLYVRRDRMP